MAVKCLMAGFEECMSSDGVLPSLIPPGTFSADFSKVIWVSSLPGHHKPGKHSLKVQQSPRSISASSSSGVPHQPGVLEACA